MSLSAQDHDILVIGAGMVGGAAASLLGRCGFSVALVEEREPAPFDASADVGLRVSAIAPGSERVLYEAGAWKSVTASRWCPYHAMHVEEAGRSGGLDFEAAAFGLEHLGSIVENDLIQSSLWSALQASPLVETHCPASVRSVDNGPNRVAVTLDSGETLRGALLLAADGADSRVRRLLGIRQDIWEYNQQGVVAVVASEEPNPGIAWQRFMPGGPLAFLPLADGRSSIVWTRPRAEADRLLAAADEAFLETLAEASSGWLGTPRSVGPRAAFPLTMRLSEHYVSGRAALLGDAAHVVHPLAGQGVNLGLADVAALVETLLEARSAGGDLAEPSRLNQWQRWRRSESEVMAGGIHGLRALFMPRGLSGLRHLGLRLVGGSWLARDFFIRRAAGLAGNSPRLSRGTPLKEILRQA